ncbi:MAG TPA: hypothetical protein VM324_00655 [Egibacteraceae bacterium]|nr:hypothetical protein [Egibacteraceae bacterium]
MTERKRAGEALRQAYEKLSASVHELERHDPTCRSSHTLPKVGIVGQVLLARGDQRSLADELGGAHDEGRHLVAPRPREGAYSLELTPRAMPYQTTHAIASPWTLPSTSTNPGDGTSPSGHAADAAAARGTGLRYAAVNADTHATWRQQLLDGFVRGAAHARARRQRREGPWLGLDSAGGMRLGGRHRGTSARVRGGAPAKARRKP